MKSLNDFSLQGKVALITVVSPMESALLLQALWQQPEQPSCSMT